MRKRDLFFRLVFSLLVGGAISTALATPGAFPTCGTATLADYESNNNYPPNGCAIGVLDYFNFSYHANAAAAGLDSVIGVTPSGQGFSFGPVSAAAGVTLNFEIDYEIVIDPSPVITGGDMSLDPPTGNVVVMEKFCNDIPYTFGTGTCLGGITPQPVPPLTVGTPVTGYPSSASVTFANPATVYQEVAIIFTLTGGTTGASFDGLIATSIVTGVAPEPASAASLLFGLLALGGYKLRKQRNN